MDKLKNFMDFKHIIEHPSNDLQHIGINFSKLDETLNEENDMKYDSFKKEFPTLSEFEEKYKHIINETKKKIQRVFHW